MTAALNMFHLAIRLCGDGFSKIAMCTCHVPVADATGIPGFDPTVASLIIKGDTMPE
jgi:hypothetical protein